MDEVLISAVEELNEKKVLKLVKKRLREGVDSYAIQEQLRLGMEKVGHLYEQGEYFIADLITAGNLLKNVLSLEEMKLKNYLFEKGTGTIVIGTAYGDIHDIGKDIVAYMLKTVGFEVVDLGVDVSSNNFVKAVMEIKPKIVAISGVLTLSINSMREVITQLERINQREKIKIIIGGNCVNSDVCTYVKADSWAKEPSETVKTCLSWAFPD